MLKMKLEIKNPTSKTSLDTLSDLKYRVNRLIGEGCNTSVYRAYCANNNPVAIKIAGDDADEESLYPIKREIKALKRLKHSHIVPILDQDENMPFIVTELMDGDLCDLMNFIKEFGLSEKERYQLTCDLVLPVAQALEYMHHNGYIHRDIKPENIFFRYKTFPPLPITCEIKMGDFGLVARIGDKYEARIQSSQIVGTEQYIAPESAVYRYYSRASDTYSFGLLVYVLATLTTPYHSLNSAEIIRFVLPALSREITLEQIAQRYRFPDALLTKLSEQSLSPFWEAMPHDLDKLANNCCKIKPEERSTMTDMVNELTDLVKFHAQPSHGGEFNGSARALTQSTLGFHHSGASSARAAADYDNLSSSVSRNGTYK